MQWLRHNWTLKLVSLAFAALLFYYVRGQEFERRHEFRVPLEIPVLADHVRLVPERDRDFVVTIIAHAPARAVEGVSAADWRVGLDMSDYRPGERSEVPVRVEAPERLRSRAPSLQITYTPRRIELHLEPVEVREFPVALQGSDTLPPAWEWEEPPRLEPAVVQVRGQRRYLEQVSRLIAVATSIPAQEEISLSIQPRVLDAEGRDVAGEVHLEPATVRLTGQMARRVWNKRTYVHVVYAGIPPEARPQVSVEPSSVTIYGSLEALRDIQFLETPVVELPAGETRLTEEVRLSPPPGVTRLEPDRVRVTLQAVPPPDRGGGDGGGPGGGR